MKNENAELLIEFGIATSTSIKPYQAQVRDRDDVSVLRCERSGVLLLSRTDHISHNSYETRSDYSYWASKTRHEALLKTFFDDSRRASMIRPLVQGRRWLDVGTGLGGVLERLKGVPQFVAAVEPQRGIRDELDRLGYTVFKALEDSPDNSFDIITMFHVYGHTKNPIEFLRTAGRKLVRGGAICIEGPNARDALLTFFECDAFKRFTLGSEQLIVHTRQSLSRFLEEAGFVQCRIQAIQRYPLANHLHWLAKGLPGGHIKWPQLVSPDLDREYEAVLATLDITDTLVAYAKLAE